MLQVSSFIPFIRSSFVTLHFVRPFGIGLHSTSLLPLYFTSFISLTFSTPQKEKLLHSFTHSNAHVHSAGFFADQPRDPTKQINTASFTLFYSFSHSLVSLFFPDPHFTFLKKMFPLKHEIQNI